MLIIHSSYYGYGHIVYHLFRAMNKSATLIAGGALVGSVLTATGFILGQEQARLFEEPREVPTVNNRLFK